MTKICIEINEQSSDSPYIQVVGEIKIDSGILSDLIDQLTEAERYTLAVDVLKTLPEYDRDVAVDDASCPAYATQQILKESLRRLNK